MIAEALNQFLGQSTGLRSGKKTWCLPGRAKENIAAKSPVPKHLNKL
jgi:hypothetical protein